ncbi:MAG: hypothetical protein IPJ24_07780 [bacterium]|nr:hypothetical protein [bacterium]
MNPIFMYVVWSTIAIAAVMSSLFLLRLLVGLGPLIARLEAIAQWLEAGRPRYAQILEDLEAQIGELRGISESARRMTGTAEDFTDELRAASQPVIDGVRQLSQATLRARAVLAAARVGMAVFLHNRRDAYREPGIHVQSNEESRV